MTTALRPPPAAAEHHAASAALAVAGAKAARGQRARGPQAVAAAVIRYQATAARQAELAIAEMLAQQNIDSAAEALLNSLAFTTDAGRLGAMVDATVESEFDRLVESLIQDAARAAETVEVAVRPKVLFVRYLNPPSCSRCTVLAGRVYTYSTGFLRHPNCDCVMLPTNSVAAPNLVQDPVELAKAGLVRGLSQADMLAIEQGADFGRVVNVRKKSGLRQAGRVLARAGRPTPEGIYALAGEDREKAVRLLKQAGYLLT